jgi:protein SCO1/2
MKLLVAYLVVFFVGLGCGERSRHYHARGVVEDVQRENGQVLIAHEEIEGLMPAMTMNFDVPDKALLDTLERGQSIDFLVEFTGKAYRVTQVSVNETGVATKGSSLGDVKKDADVAPPFRLTDQDGQPRALEDFRGQNVLLDFIFTRCPGPCPILTGLHAKVQRELPPDVQARTHFVSITLDPLRDTPAVLREYGQKRGIDFANWSFLTGAPDEVDAVLKSYGVGSARGADGNIEHVVVTFLIDGDGQIARRYIGLDGHDPKELVRDLSQLASPAS